MQSTKTILIFLIFTPATPRLLSFVVTADSFEFAEDPSVKQEFLKLDYNLADLCS